MMKEYLRKETSTLIFQLLKIEMHCIHWKFINTRLKIWFEKNFGISAAHWAEVSGKLVHEWQACVQDE